MIEMTYYSVLRAVSKLKACFSVVKKKKTKPKLTQKRTPNVHQNYLLQIIVTFMKLQPACSQKSKMAIPQCCQTSCTMVFPKFFIKKVFWVQRMHMGIGNANLFTDSDIGLSKYIPSVRAIKKKGWGFFPLFHMLRSRRSPWNLWWTFKFWGFFV